jgi:predicted methyltransferase
VSAHARARSLALALLLAACSEPGPPAGGGAAAPGAAPAAVAADTASAPAVPDPLAAALSAPGRLPGDVPADAARKPAEVLAFFGVAPGMTVLDLYSGGGYYTEILSHLAGAQGRVHAHNNTPYLSFAKDEIAQRYADPARLPNVERFIAENNALELPEARFDFVLLSMVYHDVYYADEENGWPRIDGPRMLAEIHAAMKPGAVLGLIDHAAAAGSPPETGGTLHRIDPELVKRDLAAAGFVFDGASDVLRNPHDDHTQIVFADGIRGRTDRFVFRFRRP